MQSQKLKAVDSDEQEGEKDYSLFVFSVSYLPSGSQHHQDYEDSPGPEGHLCIYH